MQTTNEHISICLNCDKSDFYVSLLVWEEWQGLGAVAGKQEEA